MSHRALKKPVAEKVVKLRRPSHNDNIANSKKPKKQGLLAGYTPFQRAVIYGLNAASAAVIVGIAGLGVYSKLDEIKSYAGNLQTRVESYLTNEPEIPQMVSVLNPVSVLVYETVKKSPQYNFRGETHLLAGIGTVYNPLEGTIGDKRPRRIEDYLYGISQNVLGPQKLALRCDKKVEKDLRELLLHPYVRNKAPELVELYETKIIPENCPSA